MWRLRVIPYFYWTAAATAAGFSLPLMIMLTSRRFTHPDGVDVPGTRSQQRMPDQPAGDLHAVLLACAAQTRRATG